MGASVIRLDEQIVLPYAPARIWPVVSDTARMNRLMGMPPVTYSAARDDEGTAVLLAQARYFGMAMAWWEYPFSWTEGRSYTVRRVFRRGPVAEMVGGCRLEDRDGGTCVRVTADVTPRGSWSAWMVRWGMVPRVRSDMRRYLRGLGDFVRLASHEAAEPARRPVVHEERLAERLEALERQGLPSRLVARLGVHLRERPDDEVVHMRPFALAERWGEPRRDVLRVFLHATREGLLDLAWSALCPSCRIPPVDYGTLADLQGQAHCDTCNIDFDVDFDRLVELQFLVNPQVRRAEARQFCIGGPANTPHVLAQARLAPGESAPWSVPEGEETLRVRVRNRQAGVRIHREAWLDEEGSEPAQEGAVTFLAEGHEPRMLVFRQGAATLTVRNGSDASLLVALEREAWPPNIVSAALVSTMPEFRRLFASEVLAPHVQVGIRSLAVLFTDLKGSTRFYQEVGDALAFALVRDHFTLLAGVVARFEGTFVKTIGDAVMAVFLDGAQAVEAALAMQRELRGWRSEHVPDPATILKVGVHQGPVVAVNLDQRLDYFGSTVNMAARIQAQSAGGDVVISRTLALDAAVASLLAQPDLQRVPFDADLSGFSEPVPLVRLLPSLPGRT